MSQKSFISVFIMMIITGFILMCIIVLPLQAIFGFKDDSDTFEILANISFTTGFFLPIVYIIIESKLNRKRFQSMGKLDRERYYKRKMEERNQYYQKKQTKSKNKGPGLVSGLALGLTKGIIDTSKEYDPNKKTTYSDKELDKWDLTEEQKKAVKSGSFEPWNFEEENLEEEDYYYEDDE